MFEATCNGFILYWLCTTCHVLFDWLIPLSALISCPKVLIGKVSQSAQRKPSTFCKKKLAILVIKNWSQTHLSRAGLELITLVLTRKRFSTLNLNHSATMVQLSFEESCICVLCTGYVQSAVFYWNLVFTCFILSMYINNICLCCCLFLRKMY